MISSSKYRKFLDELFQIFINSDRAVEPLITRLTKSSSSVNQDLYLAIKNWMDELLTSQSAETKTVALFLRWLCHTMSETALDQDPKYLELYITCAKTSLRFYTKEAYSQNWAITQFCIGRAYFTRANLEIMPKENFNSALECYLESLDASKMVSEVTDRTYTDWAEIHYELGNTYSYLEPYSLNPKEEIDKAIDSYYRATKCFMEIKDDYYTAMTLCNLGVAYHRLSDYSTIPINELKEAKTNCQYALNILEKNKQQEYLEELTTIQGNLGEVYLSLVSVSADSKDQIIKSIECYELAIEYGSKLPLPKYRAKNLVRLGGACRRMALEVDDPRDWFLRAFKNVNEAIKIFKEENYLEDWAWAQDHLGRICMDSAFLYEDKRDLRNLLKTAISHYENASKIYRGKSNSKDQINILNKLGIAYSHLAFYSETSDDLKKLNQKALQYLEEALQLCEQTHDPQTLKMLQNNLGNIYSDQITRGIHSRDTLAKSLERYRAALQGNSPNIRPRDYLMTSRNIGKLGFTQKDWSVAIEGYAKAVEAVEQLRQWGKTDRLREEISQENVEIYQFLIQSHVNSGNYSKALETVERFRCRLLTDLMATYDLYQDGDIPTYVKSFLEQYKDKQQEIEQEQRHAQQDPSSLGDENWQRSASTSRAAWQAYTERIATLEAEKQQIWQKIRTSDPVLSGELQVSTPDFASLQRLLHNQPQTALLSFYTSADDTYIFILTANSLAFHRCPEQGLTTFQDWLAQTWLTTYVTNSATWANQMPTILAEIAERLGLTNLIHSHLAGIEELLLIPHQHLHLIPFAALPIGNGQYLGDRYRLRYVPSAQILQFCQERKPIPQNHHYGTVEDADGSLPGAAAEGAYIARLYNIPEPKRLVGKQQATKANYRQLLLQTQVVHASHHAVSRLDNPLESALKLADGDITLGELLSPGYRFPDLDEVIAMNCETQMGSVQLTDNLLTLATGYLCAGARHVVCTLWSVDDMATYVFSVIYHQLRKEGVPRIKAMQLAQKQLRELGIGTFKSSFVPQLKEFLLNEVNLIDQALDQAEQAENQQECDRLTKLAIRLESTLGRLTYLTKQPRPFDHPRYWGAYICQGLS
jgi:CHAT domain-containing protein/tetratricopeptide (TPR) repeat protein